MNLFNLKNRTYLVTGASGHLGSQIIPVLKSFGANLIIITRKCSNISNLAVDKNDLILQLDLIQDEISQKVNYFLEKNNIKKIHGIIHYAYSGKTGDYSEITNHDFLASYKLNVVSLHCLIKACLPQLTSHNGRKSIIAISSMYGKVAPDLSIYNTEANFNPIHYGCSKAAMIQMMKYYSSRLSKDGITFNTVSPGPFPQDLKDSEFISKLSSKTMVKRIGHPSDLSGPIVFLLSDSSSYITGEDIAVDGGWTSY